MIRSIATAVAGLFDDARLHVAIEAENARVIRELQTLKQRTAWRRRAGRA